MAACSSLPRLSTLLVTSLLMAAVAIVTSEPEKIAQGEQDPTKELDDLYQSSEDDASPVMSRNDVIMILPLGSEAQNSLLLNLLKSRSNPVAPGDVTRSPQSFVNELMASQAVFDQILKAHGHVDKNSPRRSSDVTTSKSLTNKIMTSQSSADEIMTSQPSAVKTMTPKVSADEIMTTQSSSVEIMTQKSSADKIMTPKSSADEIMTQKSSADEIITPKSSNDKTMKQISSAEEKMTSQSSGDEIMTSQSSAGKIKTSPSNQQNGDSTELKSSGSTIIETTQTIPFLHKIATTGSTQAPTATTAENLSSSKRGRKMWTKQRSNTGPCRDFRRMNIVRFGKLPAILFSNYHCLRKKSGKNGRVRFGRKIRTKIIPGRVPNVVNKVLFPRYG